MIRTGEEDTGKGKGRGKSDHLAEKKECENDRQTVYLNGTVHQELYALRYRKKKHSIS